MGDTPTTRWWPTAERPGKVIGSWLVGVLDPRRMVPFAIALACALVSGGARADARDVAARVLEQWRIAGGQGSSVPPRFIFDEETVLVPVRPEQGEAPPSECTHVAIIGARGLSFRAKLSDAPNDPLLPPEPGARASSTAGVVELHR